MKRKLKIFSTIGLAVSGVLWVAMSLIFKDTEAAGVYLGEVFGLTLGGIPTAFLQFRLCLTDKEKWVRWVPIAVDSAVYAFAAALYITGGFGGTLLAAILAVFGLAPTAGICIGWLMHGKRIAILPLNITMIIYLAAARLPMISRPFELTDLFAIIYLLAGVYLAFRPMERGEEHESED